MIMRTVKKQLTWANFLHVYQPAEQQPDILAAVTAQCYRPLFEGIRKHSKVRLTMNINGALLELFDRDRQRDLIDMLRQLGRNGQVEFTGSAKYHAFLPLVDQAEAVRQIEMNNETNLFYLGSAYKPKGFFPPEMGYRPELAQIVESLGFTWILLDEIALQGEPGVVDYTKHYRIKGTKLNVFFRERRLSNLIMSAVVRSRETLVEAMKQDFSTSRYVLTAMDGETFGHHRPGLEQMLFEVFSAPEFRLVCLSDLLKEKYEAKEVQPVISTWASSKQDIDQGIQFLSWLDPENGIHHWQWEFVKLALTEVQNLSPKHPRYKLLRQKMDIALASDHFWWASAKPWWSLEMIEIGAWRLLEIVRMVPDIDKKKLEKARNYYEQIISTAFNWQRTGRIRQMMQEQKGVLRIPFKDRTVGLGGAEQGVYHAFMDMMERLEVQAVKRHEYEKAILWRDAKFKLEHKLDIYDTISAIDLLRVEIPHQDVEKTIEKYKAKYRKIRGGQPEQRGA